MVFEQLVFAKVVYVNGLIADILSGVIDIIIAINRLRAGLRWVTCPWKQAQVTKLLFNLI